MNTDIVHTVCAPLIPMIVSVEEFFDRPFRLQPRGGAWLNIAKRTAIELEKYLRITRRC